jgi:hypothetical protein
VLYVFIGGVDRGYKVRIQRKEQSPVKHTKI